MVNEHKELDKYESLELCFWYFIVFSFVGWFYEVLLGIFVFHLGFINRGFLFGPYCPVYGFGGLLILATVGKLSKSKIMALKVNLAPILVFAGIVILTTLLELATSYLMEIAIGEWLWDYHNYLFNFEGRIALSTSLRFGVGGMVMVYLICPIVRSIFCNCNRKVLSYITTVVFCIFLIDVAVRPFLGSSFKNPVEF